MKSSAPRAAGVAAAAVGAALGLLAADARAHEVGLSRGEDRVEGAAVRAELIFARKDLASLVAGLDADHDGAITAPELAASRGAIEGALVGRVRVKGDGAPCPGAIEAADLAEQDGIAVRARYRCPARPRRIDLELACLDDLGFGHRHLARASAGAAIADAVLSQRAPTLALDVPAAASTPAPAPHPDTSPPFVRGALHVLARHEAPAFLLAIVASSSGLRAALLASALAFAVAAAAGLVLGARGVFMPSPLALGPAISLSLVYVGVDALLANADPRTQALASPARRPPGAMRWLVALPFGVVHGLGGAAALRAPAELAGFGGGFVAALVALGVVLVPAALRARRWPAFGRRGLPALGAMVAAAGVLGLVIGRAAG